MDLSLPTTLLVNPASGRGKGLASWKMLKNVLEEKGLHPEILFSGLGPGESLGELAAKAVSEKGPMNLLIAGGDGSMQEVLNGIALEGYEKFSQVNLGALPMGSSNDFLRSIGQKGPGEAVRAVLEAQTVTCRDGIKVTAWEENGLVTQRIALVSAGFGFDAATCVYANRSALKGFLNKLGLGEMIYVLVALRLILAGPIAPVEIKVFQNEAENETEEQPE